MAPLSQFVAGAGTGEMGQDLDEGHNGDHDEGRLIEQALRVARRTRSVDAPVESLADTASEPSAAATDASPLEHPGRPDTDSDPEADVDSKTPDPHDMIKAGRGSDPAVLADDELGLDGFELLIEDFGANWSETVRGWVVDRHGNTVWRPIVTTTPEVPNWTIESTLGVVRGESAVGLDLAAIRRLLAEPGGRAALERRLHLDRTAAEQAMVEEAVARGAHAVVGVTSGHTPIGAVMIITCTGTAVTLAAPRQS